MKKIMNNPENIVAEMCSGIAMAHPDLEFISEYKIIKKKEINKNKVTLISGGGSGHEPAHAGFVGKGMLDAAVCGDVFASPSQIQVYKAIRKTAGDKGTLLIIKNYSGDLMNFKNAAYMAKEDGLEVDYVRVDDDIAVQDSLYTVGRRGVAGTVFVHKIAGAAAEAGMSLQEVKRIAEKTITNVRTFGFALTSCTVPARQEPTFELGEKEMEFGVGIHGEPGIRRENTTSADKLSERIVSALLTDLQIKEKAAAEVAVLINGFGGTPLQELYLLNHSVVHELDKAGVEIGCTFVGNYMTSIDMAGASVTLLKLDSELKELLFYVSDAPGFKISGPVEMTKYRPALTEQCAEIVSYKVETDGSCSLIRKEKITRENMIYIIDKMCEIIIENEVHFCELDSFAGDGDFGMSIAKGFRRLKEKWPELIKNKEQTIGDFLEKCSIILMEHCGGASGPIWGSAFRAAGRCAKDKCELTVSDFAEMLQAAVAGIQETGRRCFGRGAVVGDKTLMDALIPCADSWTASARDETSVKRAFIKGADAAMEGAKATENFVAHMGRAGTVGERSIGHQDAGAHALGLIFEEITHSLNESCS